MSEDEFTAQLRAQTLAAFGLKAWDAGLAPVPWHVRLWRAVTFAKRRGKVVGWDVHFWAVAASIASHAGDPGASSSGRMEAFRAELPGRAQAIADDLSALLPDGLRFEWAPDEERP